MKVRCKHNKKDRKLQFNRHREEYDGEAMHTASKPPSHGKHSHRADLSVYKMNRMWIDVWVVKPEDTALRYISRERNT